MIARVCPRLGLAALLATSASACASDLDRAHVVAPDAPRPPRAQIYDRDRALVAGFATSLALGIVGLGTMLASGIYAAPAHGDPHPVPRAIVVTGGVMSAGFLATIPFAIAVERHRARYPDLFPHQRGRTRVPAPNTPPPSLRAHNGLPGLSRQRTAAGPSLTPPAVGPAISLRPAPGPGPHTASSPTPGLRTASSSVRPTDLRPTASGSDLPSTVRPALSLRTAASDQPTAPGPGLPPPTLGPRPAL